MLRWLRKIEPRQEPPGAETALLRRMPVILVAGSLAPLVVHALAGTWVDDGAASKKALLSIDIFLIAAVVTYLLMALMWSFAYALLEFYQPGSFNSLEGLTRDSRQFFLYYSFVTLTTLGFGDITPLTEKAKALTILQAFIGQIYLVVILAWLVGMHVSRKSR